MEEPEVVDSAPEEEMEESFEEEIEEEQEESASEVSAPEESESEQVATYEDMGAGDRPVRKLSHKDSLETAKERLLKIQEQISEMVDDAVVLEN